MEEHNLIRKAMEDLENLSERDEDFFPKLKVLLDMVNHYVDGEEKMIFPKAKQKIKKGYEKKIADSYLNFKEAFVS